MLFRAASRGAAGRSPPVCGRAGAFLPALCRQTHLTRPEGPQQPAGRGAAGQADPSRRAAAILGMLPGPPLLSRTGTAATAALLAVAAVSNELYVVSEETIILGSFLGTAWLLASSGRQHYVGRMGGHAGRVRSLLLASRQQHAAAVGERIRQVAPRQDLAGVTRRLFQISKETVQLEARAFELCQTAAAQQQARAVLDSWVRYESALRRREQTHIAETVISRVGKELQQPGVQQQILGESIAKIEDLLR